MNKPLTALISVSDKTGVVDFARALAAQGLRLLSTGGTAKLLSQAGLAVTEVAEVTGSPEMLDGRVKTLHPRIHGALLARRDRRDHMAALAEHGIGTIDLLVVNLYPFAAATARADCTLDDAVENIDIGGPAMLRAAAKNWADVTVLVDPADYPRVQAELAAGGVARRTRLALAKKVYAHTAAYDATIANYLGSLPEGAESDTAAVPSRDAYPAVYTLQFTKAQELRYGENPHQGAAFYRDAEPAAGSLATCRQLQGKALSYNNIADADAAWECVKTFGDGGGAQDIAAAAACVIVKHANPCGVAVAATCAEAYTRAFATDPTSAFGGIIAFNRPLDGATAERVARQFVEVVIAPAYSADALAVFAPKTNVRLLEVALPAAADATGRAADADADDFARDRTSDALDHQHDQTNAFDYKRVGGGLLVQSRDVRDVAAGELRVVTRVAPTPAQMGDLMFAWKVAKYVKSNAIVFCGNGQTLGVGAGQMSRVDSARIAAIKAANAGLSLAGSAVASDAFFPFRDGLDVVVDAGARCVVQPGGSLRDDEVIEAADERGVAMVLTGVRHFRH